MTEQAKVKRGLAVQIRNGKTDVCFATYPIPEDELLALRAAFGSWRDLVPPKDSLFRVAVEAECPTVENLLGDLSLAILREQPWGEGSNVDDPWYDDDEIK